MILLEPAYKILHANVKFKRRTISVTPFSRNSVLTVEKALVRDADFSAMWLTFLFGHVAHVPNVNESIGDLSSTANRS